MDYEYEEHMSQEEDEGYDLSYEQGYDDYQEEEQRPDNNSKQLVKHSEFIEPVEQQQTSLAIIERPVKGKIVEKQKIKQKEIEPVDPQVLTLKELITRSNLIEKRSLQQQKNKKSDSTNNVNKNPTKINQGQNLFQQELNNQQNLQEMVQRGPQLKLVDGRLVVDNEIQQQQEMINYPMYQGEADGKLNYSAYLKREKGSKWTREENKIFFKALKQFGTNFDMIAKLFPNRNRNQIKRKFTVEEKNNSHKLDMVLNHRNPNLKKINKLTKIIQDNMLQETNQMHQSQQSSQINLQSQSSIQYRQSQEIDNSQQKQRGNKMLQNNNSKQIGQQEDMVNIESQQNIMDNQNYNDNENRYEQDEYQQLYDQYDDE